MRKVICVDCGKHYDYDEDGFCPRCGTFNSPADSGATRMEYEQLERFNDGRRNQVRGTEEETSAPGHRKANRRRGAAAVGAAPEAGRAHSARIETCRPCREQAGREETGKRSPLAVIVLIIIAACVIANVLPLLMLLLF